MFSELTNFAKKRSLKESIGFYFAYTISIFIVLILVVVALEILFSIGADVGRKLGMLVAFVAPMIMSYLIVKSKQMLSFKYFLFILLSGLLGFFGIFIGFIPVAFLTTKEPNYPSENTDIQSE